MSVFFEINIVFLLQNRNWDVVITIVIVMKSNEIIENHRKSVKINENQCKSMKIWQVAHFKINFLFLVNRYFFDVLESRARLLYDYAMKNTMFITKNARLIKSVFLPFCSLTEHRASILLS